MIAACYILHYGQEWLNWSIRSIASEVDQIHVFYTPFPSHGHGTNLLCPETRDSIRISIPAWLNYSHFHWHDCGRFAHEGHHREFAVNTCAAAGAETVLVVDADELWNEDVLQNALITALNNPYTRTFRIGMRHFWRSLDWICDDAAMPTRVINVKAESGEAYLGDDVGKVYHMGYAQSAAIIRYKMEIHGHKAEWRPEWYEDKFMAWGNGHYVSDVHPTNKDYWNPILIDYETAAHIRALCHDHPYLDAGKII